VLEYPNYIKLVQLRWWIVRVPEVKSPLQD